MRRLLIHAAIAIFTKIRVVLQNGPMSTFQNFTGEQNESENAQW